MPLPVPTGRFHVGEVTPHHADTTRHDPWHTAEGDRKPVAERGLARPSPLMEADGGVGHRPWLDRVPGSCARLEPQLGLRGAEHASFTGAETPLPQLDLPRATLPRAIGTIRPAIAVRTDEACASAFFGHWLRGTHDHLPDGPEPRYPAMEFVD